MSDTVIEIVLKLFCAIILILIITLMTKKAIAAEPAPPFHGCYEVCEFSDCNIVNTVPELYDDCCRCQIALISPAPEVIHESKPPPIPVDVTLPGPIRVLDFEQLVEIAEHNQADALRFATDNWLACGQTLEIEMTSNPSWQKIERIKEILRD